jgi:HSP20 family molecular chaperone IbpA
MAKKATNDNVPTIHQGEHSFFETFEGLQAKIRRRANEIFRSRPPQGGDQVSDWLQAESEVLTQIAMNFEEEDDQYVLRGEIPGFSSNEVELLVDNDILSVTGTHTEQAKKKTKSGEERRSSEVSFFRRMPLPADADADHMNAKVEGGMLEVTFPKNKQAER